MKVVLLSGGRGSRLWPLSTNDTPKQFIKIGNEGKTMLKETFDLVNNRENDLYIATCEQYVESIKNELNDFKNIIVEPQAIGTFPAILNIVVYFYHQKNYNPEEIISIIPIDHKVNDKFYEILKVAKEEIIISNSNICLIGIKPTFISTQYGYIQSSNGIISEFIEKPNKEIAEELIKQNALWNSGVLILKLGNLVKLAKEYIDIESYEKFIENYINLPHNSFDKEFLEKEKNISIVKSPYEWEDLGTWEILSEKMTKPDKFNTSIINFENKKILNEGVEDIILINSIDGIKIVNKNKPKNKYQSWGSLEIINCYESDDYQINITKININKGEKLNCPRNLSVNWYIKAGQGQINIDNVSKKIKPGDVLKIEKKQKLLLKVFDNLEIIEVAYGKPGD